MNTKKTLYVLSHRIYNREAAYLVYGQIAKNEYYRRKINYVYNHSNPKKSVRVINSEIIYVDTPRLFRPTSTGSIKFHSQGGHTAITYTGELIFPEIWKEIKFDLKARKKAWEKKQAKK